MSEASPFKSHLSELRSSLIKSFFFIGLGFLGSWFFVEDILNFVRSPIEPFLQSTEGKLIFISPVEKFLSFLKLSFFSGVVFSCPFWMFQIWKFISPGLYKKERSGAVLFVFAGSFLFLMGGGFVYFIVYPPALRFLLFLGGEGAIPFISLKEYLSFFIKTSLVFSLLFETPLLISFLLKFKIVSLDQIKKSRRFIFVLVAVISAFLTPPDVTSMLLMMIPIYLLFEGSLLIGRWFA